MGGNTYKQFYANQLTLNIGCGTWTTLDESGLTKSYTIYRDLHTITTKVSIPRGKNIGETTYLSIPKDCGKNGVVTAF